MRLCTVGQSAHFTTNIIASYENPLQFGYRGYAERAEMGVLFHIGRGRCNSNRISAIPYDYKEFQ